MQRRSSLYLSPAVCVAVAATALATASPASAQTEVPCDSAALVQAVNSAGPDDTLELAPGCRYVLTASLQINVPLTIHGNNATITRSTSAPSFGVLKVNADLDLDRITITNGDATTSFGDFGGAIAVLNGSTLTLDRSNIRDNQGSFSGGLGGDRFTTMHVTQSQISDNHAFHNGGGIAVDGTLELIRSRVVNNTADVKGGGIANDGHNRATKAPGGFDNEGGVASVTLDRSRVNGNVPTNCAPTVVIGCRN